MLDKKVVVKLLIRWDYNVFEMPAGLCDYQEEEAIYNVLAVSILGEEVVDDYEGTQAEGSVEVFWEEQVVNKRMYQRIQKD